MDKIRLIAEHSLTYAPHHVAEHLGLFRDLGVTVETSYASGPGGSWLGDVLGRGEADIARGGIWIPLMYRARLERFRIFAELCARNCQLLMARAGDADFTLSDLEGRTVLLPMAATSQWMFFRHLLEEKGVDPDAVRWIRDLEASTMVRLWRAGLGDHLLIGPPVADDLVAEGHAVAADLGTLGGPVPWSVYYAPDTSELGEVLARFVAALSQAADWISDTPAEDVARLIAPDFPALQVPSMTRAIARMSRHGTWPSDLGVSPAPFDRYQRMIARHGLIEAPVAHADCLWPDIAAQSRPIAQKAQVKANTP